MFILTFSVLYFLPFGNNIMKFDFFYIQRKFVGMEPSCYFLQFFIYLFNSCVKICVNRTEQKRTLYFDREVSVHIYKYIHMYICLHIGIWCYA